jgi:hypothetical protein
MPGGRPKRLEPMAQRVTDDGPRCFDDAAFLERPATGPRKRMQTLTIT